jgi:arylsulfatase A-like enzyme
MSFHGFELWEELVRVPLIVHVPGVAPRIVAGHHSHIDIVPTLLDVLGIPYEAGEVSGRSLSSTWSGLPESEPARDTCLDMPDGPYTRLRRGVVFGSGAGMKAVTTGVRTSVYDLERDPGERYDLAKDAEQLRSAMAALRRCRERMRIVEVPAVEPRL